jgi:signal transduction histidine kinase
VHRPVLAVMGSGRVLRAAGLTRRRLAMVIGGLVLLVAGLSVILAAPGHPQAVQEGAVAALFVAAAGTIVVLIRSPGAGGPDLAALVAVGLAGAALAGLLPQTQAYLISYLALAGLGLRASLRAWAAIAGALAVFAGMNAAYVLVAGGSLTGLITQDIGLVFIFAFVRATRLAEERARAAQRQAEILVAELRATQSARAEAAALAERTRLAREIHDVLAHALSGLILALDTMELQGRQPDPGPATVERMLGQVGRAQRIARDGLADTRQAIAALRGDALPGPALLDRLVHDTAAATGVSGRLTIDGAERPLPPEIGLTVYRTAQEALTNTARYAGPGAVAEVRLSYTGDAVELVVEDQPAGDVPARRAALSGGGYGLTGMRERAELLGGSLTAGPAGTGFAVRLRLPTTSRPQPGPAPVAVVRRPQPAPAHPGGS